MLLGPLLGKNAWNAVQRSHLPFFCGPPPLMKPFSRCQTLSLSLSLRNIFLSLQLCAALTSGGRCWEVFFSLCLWESCFSLLESVLAVCVPTGNPMSMKIFSNVTAHSWENEVVLHYVKPLLSKSCRLCSLLMGKMTSVFPLGKEFLRLVPSLSLFFFNGENTDSCVVCHIS